MKNEVKRGWYFFMLLLPLLVPVAYLISNAMILKIGRQMGHFADVPILENLMKNQVSELFILQLAFTGPQYLLFIAVVVFWWWKKTPEQIVRSSWKLPFVFAPLSAIPLILFPGGALITVLAVIFFGYWYLLVARGLLWIIANSRKERA